MYKLSIRSFLLIILLCLSHIVSIAEPIPAKRLFGKVKTPSQTTANAYGSYSKGCLAGGKMLPINGPSWQAMRLSRNRNWGHPNLVDLVVKLANESQKVDGWPGLLVGDLAQPRGGPMLTGHASHQIGLDADIWLKPMPNRRYTRSERERISAISMIRRGKGRRWEINKPHWKPGHYKLIKRAASYPGVARIFIHPTIKKALCTAAGEDNAWLSKVRPWWGHHYHFHIRMNCPEGSVGCKNQPAPPAVSGCGKQLDYWLKLVNPRPKQKKVITAKKPKKKPKKRIVRKKRRYKILSDLPHYCQAVLGKENIPASAFVQKIPLPVRRPNSLKVAQNEVAEKTNQTATSN